MEMNAFINFKSNKRNNEKQIFENSEFLLDKLDSLKEIIIDDDFDQSSSGSENEEKEKSQEEILKQKLLELC